MIDGYDFTISLEMMLNWCGVIATSKIIQLQLGEKAAQRHLSQFALSLFVYYMLVYIYVDDGRRLSLVPQKCYIGNDTASSIVPISEKLQLRLSSNVQLNAKVDFDIWPLALTLTYRVVCNRVIVQELHRAKHCIYFLARCSRYRTLHYVKMMRQF